MIHEFPVRVRNVSLSGCLLESPHHVRPAATGELRLSVGGFEYRDAVRVVRQTSRRIEGSDANAEQLTATEFAWRTFPGACSLRAIVPESLRNGSSPIVVPELQAEDLVLWRLLGGRHALCCAVRSHTAGLHLWVREETSGSIVIEEVHRQLAQAVKRAEQMRQRCLADGWQPVD